MPFLIVFYLLVGGIILSIWHSTRVIRAGAMPVATVNEILEAAREKKIIRMSLLSAAGYFLAILTSLLWSDFFYTWVVLTPFIYLSVWAFARFFR